MSAVDDYQAATEALATGTEREALAVYADVLADRIPPGEATLLLAALINRANATAVSLADVWLAVQIEEQAGQPVPTVGVLPVDDSERLVKAADTILTQAQPVTPEPAASGSESSTAADLSDVPDRAERSSAESRLIRLARAEPLEAAQRATHNAMQQQPWVEGWVRHMDADPCQLCRWWWREGRVWPKAHRMPRHTGCNCQPKVVLAKSIKPTQYTRKLERNI